MFDAYTTVAAREGMGLGMGTGTGLDKPTRF